MIQFSIGVLLRKKQMNTRGTTRGSHPMNWSFVTPFFLEKKVTKIQYHMMTDGFLRCNK